MGEELTALHPDRQDPGSLCRARTGGGVQTGGDASSPKRARPRLEPLAAALTQPLGPVGRTVTAPNDQPRRAVMRDPERSCFDLHQPLRQRLGEGGPAVQPSLAGRPATKAGNAPSVSSSGPASAATRVQAVPPTTRAPMPAKTRVQLSPAPPDLVIGGLARVFSSSRLSQRPSKAAPRDGAAFCGSGQNACFPSSQVSAGTTNCTSQA